MAAPLQRLFAGRVMHFISGQPGAWGSLRAVHSAITSQQQPAVLADGAAAPQPVPASPASPASQQATSGQTETAAETTSAQVEAAAGTVPLHEPPPIASWMYRHIKQKGNISMAGECKSACLSIEAHALPCPHKAFIPGHRLLGAQA